MTKRLLMTGLGLVFLASTSLWAAGNVQHEVLPAGDMQTVQTPNLRAPCAMTKTSGNATSYWSDYESGFQCVTYFNPEVECSAPTYPFEITSFGFMLYDAGGYTWPAQVDVVVYDLATPGDSCQGPGSELCRYSVSADQATYEYPNVGTYTFPTPCCVNGPFFIGLEYTAGVAGGTPSVLFDDQGDLGTVDTCDNWQYNTTTWVEWFDFWSQPGPGYPIYYVGGETESPNCDELVCDWKPGDDYKMHYPQLPDEAGWDVNATQPIILADDFMCMETGPIKDVHFWGSWRHGIEGEILQFVLSLHTDIPADQSPTGYSMPGETIREWEVTDFDFTPIDPPSMEGWFDPATGEVFPNDHQAYFQYNVCFDEPEWEWQDSGTVYWLNISAIIADPTETQWGWKSTQDHWNDDAVFAFWGALDWQELYEPGLVADTLVNVFDIAVDAQGTFIGGSGSGAYGQGWYFYPEGEWWNIWFYDHPLDTMRWKTIHLEYDAFPYESGPSFLEVAINWSTEGWESPPGDSIPPLPGNDPFVGRYTVFVGEMFEGHYIFDFEIPDYNPEWVSVDVRGFNYIIPEGIIVHACVGQQSLDLAFVITNDWDEPPPDSGACCYYDGVDWLCTYTTQDDCETVIGGVYEGNGTQCQGMEACCLQNGDCVMADALCCVNELNGSPQGAGSQCTALEACCMADGSCQDLDPLCCVDQGGVPQGPGTMCTVAEACCMPGGGCQMFDPLCCDEQGGTPQGNGTACGTMIACCFNGGVTCQTMDILCCDDEGGTPSPIGAPACLGDFNPPNGIDDACEHPTDTTGACCFDSDSTCANLTESDCQAQGGDYMGDGTMCLGDNDGNGIDDACDGGFQGTKMHYPQLPDPAGWDVMSMYPVLTVADDWRCTQSGYITDIYWWGSWFDGVPGNILNFWIGFWTDIPAHPPDIPYSRPGEEMWWQVIPYAEIEVAHVDGFPYWEGWLIPYGTFFPNNHQVFEMYHIQLPEDMWFVQHMDTIYWISIMAEMAPEPPWSDWGWKSSYHHFNDDATWSFYDPPFVWTDLWEPPDFDQSMDMAFVLINNCCIGTVGSVQLVPAAFGDPPCDPFEQQVDISDLTNLIDHLFISFRPLCCRPEADLEPLMSGGLPDGAVDIADLTAMIDHLFINFPPLPPCP